LHAEIARSINFYKGQQGGSPPVRVLLSGGSSIIPYTDRFFKEKIQTEIEYFNPFRNVEIDPRISREELARSAHFFGEVVGLGLRKHTECPIEVDLLPNSVRTRQQMRHKRPYLAGAGVCVLLIPLCWLGYTQKTMNLTRRQLDVVTDTVNNLNDLTQKLTREQGQLAELSNKADQVVSLIHQRSLWPELLQDLNERLGSNIWIVSLTPQAETAAGGPAAASGAAHGGRIRQPVHTDDSEAEALPGSAAPAGSGRMIGELHIEGAGIHSVENPERDIQLVYDFAKSLSESTNFYDKAGVVIDVPPNPMLQGQTFTFTVRAKLAKPLPM
jgi:hypothetical protein